MPKKKDKQEIDKKLKEFLNELNDKENLTEEDTDKLNNLFTEAFNAKYGNHFLYYLRNYFFKFIILYSISLLSIAPFIPSLSINKNYSFLISAVVAGVYLLVYYAKASSLKLYLGLTIVAHLLIIGFAVLFNQQIEIFNNSTLWIFYLLMVVIFYNLFSFFLIRRKIRKIF